MKKILIAAAAASFVTSAAHAIDLDVSVGDVDVGQVTLAVQDYLNGGNFSGNTNLDNGLTLDDIQDAEYILDVINNTDAQFILSGVTVEDVDAGLTDHTIGIDSAIDFADDAAAEAYEQKINDYINDPNGVNAEAIADGHEVYVGDPSGAPGN